MIDESLLTPGITIDNDRLCEIFKCSTQGGMRRSLKTGTLVIVSNHVESIYHDRWINNVLHYTGMGQSGDQRIDRTQNATLAQSDSNGVDVYLFEKWEPREYQFTGRVSLQSVPYEETQPDAQGQPRKVWVFPLALIRGQAPAIQGEILAKVTEQRNRKASRLSDAELAERARNAPRQPGTTNTSTTQHVRNEYVADFAKRRAAGICDLCLQPAPFKNKKNEAFLETHHIVWLARGGDDSTDNTVALCPNCHRRMHVRDDAVDREKLNARLSRYDQ